MEMSGCSITLLELDEELKELIDYKADTPGLKV
jgi:dihydroxyacetone kinase-like protein